MDNHKGPYSDSVHVAAINAQLENSRRRDLIVLLVIIFVALLAVIAITSWSNSFPHQMTAEEQAKINCIKAHRVWMSNLVAVFIAGHPDSELICVDKDQVPIVLKHNEALLLDHDKDN